MATLHFRPPQAIAARGTSTTANEAAGSDLLFAGYLALLLIEYLGLGAVVPLLQVSRIPTMLAWALLFLTLQRIGIQAFVEYTQSRLLLGLLFFTGFTVFYAFIQREAVTAFRSHADYFALFVITLYLVDRPARLKKMALAFSVMAVVMVVRNLDRLTASTRQGAMAGAYFTGDGNDFAWALCTFLPLALIPVLSKGAVIGRMVGVVGIFFCLAGIVGTQSRGAALAVAAMALYYWLMIARRKVLGVVFVAGLLVAGLPFLPSQYVERMETISNYQEDGSATSRLKMWGIAVRMAVDYPLGVGAGNFSAAYGLIYLPKEQLQEGWGSRRWLGAHSVYFRVLGEYGVLGLLVIFTAIVVNFRTNERTHQKLRGRTPEGAVVDTTPRLLNMSLVGYAVAGAFLGGLTYPHLYLISALTAGAKRRAETAPAAAPPREEPPKLMSGFVPRHQRRTALVPATLPAARPAFQPVSERPRSRGFGVRTDTELPGR